MQDVPALHAQGLLQPLEPLLPEDLATSLYPVARTAGTVKGSWVAVQVTADFFHLAYRQDRLPTPPQSWDAVLNSEARYAPLLFAAGGEDSVADTVLLQYMAAGGSIAAQERPALNEQALLSLFSFYDQAIRRSVIPRSLLRQASNPDVLWTALAEGTVEMADIPARAFVQQALTRGDIAAAALPTWDGQPRALVQGWGLSITASAPERRQAAATFIAWLLQPDVLGEWSQRSQRIPLQRAALERWNAPTAYMQTMDTLLRNATPQVEGPHVTALRQALAVGLRALVDEGATPEDAVRRTREAYLSQ